MARKHIAIIGGGPAGLIAADHLSSVGHHVSLYEQMPTVGRKLLMAGKSGLNLTHSEEFSTFRTRFSATSKQLPGPLSTALDSFSPQRMREWALELGIETFIGSSGRVFPKAMKASPLLRAWLKRLQSQHVNILTRYRWTGFDGENLCFASPSGNITAKYDAVLFALGGASWPKLGSDAKWLKEFQRQNVEVTPFKPANCGFDVEWSGYFAERFAGEPVKSVVVTSDAGAFPGEFVITRNGIEGSLIYAHTAALRDCLEQGGDCIVRLDLVPGRSVEKLQHDLERQGNKPSFSTLLRKGAGLTGVKVGLIRELSTERTSKILAGHIKNYPLEITHIRPIDEAISSAGGVSWQAVDGGCMLKKRPGMFVAGEMLDWEAPTGGYLLTACFATGLHAARHMDQWLERLA